MIFLTQPNSLGNFKNEDLEVERDFLRAIFKRKKKAPRDGAPFHSL